MSAQVDVNQLLQNYATLQAQVAQLQQQAKAREASIYISRNQNLTLTWRKFGVQRSFLIPSKRQDGTMWLRGGGVPCTYTLQNGHLIVKADLPVDDDEAKTFQEKFLMQSIVQPSTPGRQPNQPTTTPDTPTPAYIPPAPISVSVPTPTPVPVPTTDSDSDTIVSDAQDLIKTGLYKDLISAVRAVKKSKGIK